jgi:hypothetical protein
MSIDFQTMQDAVLRIFAAQGVSAGESLSLESLKAQWPRARLRRSDLVQAVRQLVFSGELELDEDADGPQLILTERGYQRGLLLQMPASAQRPRGFWAQMLSGKPQPLIVAVRPPEPAGTPRPRRSTDAV